MEHATRGKTDGNNEKRVSLEWNVYLLPLLNDAYEYFM